MSGRKAVTVSCVDSYRRATSLSVRRDVQIRRKVGQFGHQEPTPNGAKILRLQRDSKGVDDSLCLLFC
jgi:hypothetical protein